jgi:hypothetical protein
MTCKSYDIPKTLVWEAWLRVKANQGAAGIDSESIEGFETKLAANLYKLWNRMSSGSYFPPPVCQSALNFGSDSHLMKSRRRFGPDSSWGSGPCRGLTFRSLFRADSSLRAR